MAYFFDILKTILFGIVEGITEWLPISSTGHLLILQSMVGEIISHDFMEMFDVVIQLGAILAVVVIYFNKLNPFSSKKTAIYCCFSACLYSIPLYSCAMFSA